MHDLLNVHTRVYPEVGAAITTDLIDFGGSTGVVAVMNFGAPIEVIRMGIVVDDNELLDVGAGFSIALKKYLIPGSSTNAVTLGTITSTADVAKGDGLYNDFRLGDENGETAEDGELRYVSPRSESDIEDNDFVVLPGQQLVWDLTDAADTSGKGQVFVQYIERPFTGSDLTDRMTRVDS
jgi:hypothetical protein